MHDSPFGLPAIAALLVALDLSACVSVVGPRHDYPSDVAAADWRSTSQCPIVTGRFENAGTWLTVSRTSTAQVDPIFLTSFILAPGTIPSGAEVTTLELLQTFSADQSLLQIKATSTNATVAEATIPGNREIDAFQDSKPFSRFLCDGNNLVVYSERNSLNDVAVRLYRGKDGSLILARERIQRGTFVVQYEREWFRFQQAEARRNGN